NTQEKSDIRHHSEMGKVSDNSVKNITAKLGEPSRPDRHARGGSEKGVDDPHGTVVLSVVQVFGVEDGCAGLCGGGDNHGIPKGKLPTGFGLKPLQKKLVGVRHDLPRGEVVDEGGGGCIALTGAGEVDEEFLQNLDTDGGAGRLAQRRSHQPRSDGSLVPGVAVVSVEEDVGVEEPLNGHGSHPG